MLRFQESGGLPGCSQSASEEHAGDNQAVAGSCPEAGIILSQRWLRVLCLASFGERTETRLPLRCAVQQQGPPHGAKAAEVYGIVGYLLSVVAFSEKPSIRPLLEEGTRFWGPRPVSHPSFSPPWRQPMGKS